MTFFLWPATRHDVAGLVANMRKSDIEEITFNAEATGRKGSGWSIDGELHSQFDKFPHWVILKETEVVAVGGVAPLQQNNAIGAIWLLGTDLADIHWRELTRFVRRFIEMSHSDYFSVGNVLPVHMEKRRRWLEYLGFDFSNSEAQLPHHGLVAFWSHSPNGPKDGPSAP